MGSLFHRDSAAGATTEKNTERSIITRSGSLLRFTDSEDEKTFKIELQYNTTNGIVLTVKEDEGTMTIQTTKEIYVKAPELIQFESKKIVLLAEETIQANAKDRIDMVAEKTVHIESPEKLELMAKDMTETAENGLNMAGKEINIKADSSMTVDGGKKYEFKATSVKSNQ
jgi:hypothetical protein